MTMSDSKAPLMPGDWITVVTPMGAQITLYRSQDFYRVTASDCYTRRLREPGTFPNERPARDLARVWTIELLRNSTTFEVKMMRNEIQSSYSVDLEAK